MDGESLVTKIEFWQASLRISNMKVGQMMSIRSEVWGNSGVGIEQCGGDKRLWGIRSYFSSHGVRGAGGGRRAQALPTPQSRFSCQWPWAYTQNVGHEQRLSLDLRPDSTTHKLFPLAGPSTRLSSVPWALNADASRTRRQPTTPISAKAHARGRPRILIVGE